MKEVQRITNPRFNTRGHYYISCFGCGKWVELAFNGGELDWVEHCGYLYRLEAPQIDCVVYKDEEEPAPVRYEG